MINLIKEVVEISSINAEKFQINNFTNKFFAIGFVKDIPGIHFIKNLEIANIMYKFNNFSYLFTRTFVQIPFNIPCYTFHVDKAKTVNENEVKS